MVDAVATKSFAEILESVREVIGDERHDMWFREIRLLEFYRGTITIGVPNIFFRDWITENYAGLLTRKAQDVLGVPARIEVKVDPELYRVHKRTIDQAALVESLDVDDDEGEARSLDDFVTVPENEFAVGTVRRVVENREARFNPLVIIGPPGCGKSHLMAALKDYRGGEEPEKPRVLHLSALDFTSRFTMSLKMKSIETFRQSFDRYDVLCFDEVHRLKGKKATQAEWLHLLTRKIQGGVQVVMASRHHPKEVHDLSPTIQSILLSGMMATLDTYGTTSMAQIVSEGYPQPASLDGEIVRALSANCRGNVRELRARILRVYAYAGLLGERVTPEFVDRHLEELNGTAAGRQDAEAVVDSVCAIFGVGKADFLSKRKVKSLIMPRAVAACVLRDRHRLTFKDIGQVLGGRSHTSIYLMYKKYLPTITADPELRNIAERIPLDASQGTSE